MIFDWILKLNWNFRDLKDTQRNQSTVLQSQCLLYRQVQIMAIIYNSCFRKWILPLIEGVLGVLSIYCLQGAFALKAKNPFMAFFVFPSTFITIQFIVVGILENASKTLPQSRAAIRSMENCRNRYNRKGVKSLTKSCQLIGIRTGGYHVIRRERYAIILRFILQRTFFCLMYFDYLDHS